MWSYIAGGLKIKVIQHRKFPFGIKSSFGIKSISLWDIIKGGLKIEACKIEGLLYILHIACVTVRSTMSQTDACAPVTLTARADPRGSGHKSRSTDTLTQMPLHNIQYTLLTTDRSSTGFLDD